MFNILDHHHDASYLGTVSLLNGPDGRGDFQEDRLATDAGAILLREVDDGVGPH